MGNLDCKKPKPCVPEEKEKEIYPPPTPAFTACLGDYSLKWDGARLYLERPRQTPDGTYSSVTVVDGCVIGFGQGEVPTYTPPYCNPNPCPCQEGSGGDGDHGGGSVNISSKPDNIIVNNVDGLYAKCYVKGGNAISVTGSGTVRSPYVIDYTGGIGGAGGSTVIVGRNGIDVDRRTANVSYVGLTETGIADGWYGAGHKFHFDKYGRAVDIEKTDSPPIKGGAGLETTVDEDEVTIGHPRFDVEGPSVLGGYTATINETGHVTHLRRDIDIDAGVYNFGAYNVGLNSYGSVTSIVQRDDVMPGPGTFTTTDGKKFSYDTSGRLTGVEGSGGSSSGSYLGGSGAKGPIIDVVHVWGVKKDTNSGTSRLVGLNFETTSREVDIKFDGSWGALVHVPSYVTSANQIDTLQRQKYANTGIDAYVESFDNDSKTAKMSTGVSGEFDIYFRG